MENNERERKRALYYKYRHDRDMDPKDLPLIDELCLTGLMNKGLSRKRKVITAKTTEQGMAFCPWWYPLKALSNYLHLSWHHFKNRNNATS